MPAVSVSVCDPLAVALRHNLDTAGQSKSSDNLNIGLTGSATHILRAEIEFEETDNYRSSEQDRLKNKYTVLGLPKQDNMDKGTGKVKDAATCSKNSEKGKEPRLPDPATTLYPADKVNLGWDKNCPVGAGMYNVGNTCYLNSTLQALFHVPALVNWLLSDDHHNSKCEQYNDGASECLTCAVAKTLQFSHQKSGEAIKPFYVYNKLKQICKTMVPGQQEDAHEFLRYLLEGMEKAYLTRHKATKLDSYSKETTPINQIFGGYIRTEVKCLQCRHISTTFQHFQDLLLDIQKAGTLDKALAGYFSQEQLDNNDYKCEACKRRVPATKQFILERPPKVLCVQLKRFSVLGGKISRYIGFKQTVDMGPYMRQKPGEPINKVLYKLTSMVTHMGPSVNCGHYTAVAQVSSGKFYSFDDSSVRPISLNNVLDTHAYIMVFEMEPPLTSNQVHNNQHPSLKIEISTPKSSLSFPHSNGFSNKSLDNKSFVNSVSKSSENGSSLSPLSASPSTSSFSSKFKNRDTATTPPPPPLPPFLPSNQVKRNFIGPQLPPNMEKNRLSEISKNGKLVDYDDGSSGDEENNNSASSSKASNDRETVKSTNNSLLSKSPKTNGTTSSRSPLESPSPHNENGHSSLSNGLQPTNGTSSNGTKNSSDTHCSNSSSSRDSTPKNDGSNGKTEHCNGVTYDKEKSKDKWHHSKPRTDSSEQKVYTKASASINKGWHVSKDSSSPSSSTAANGWLVSDNLSDEPNRNIKRSNNYPVTANAAEMRSFNGTNRSDVVSHLQKSSQWGYGNSNVHSWNGGKARVDREVDNQRRMDRKRSYDNDDDDMDRGRTKKMKSHNNDYENRYSKYNPFQERQNDKWRPHFRPNTHYRPRHGGSGNYNRNPNHRYHHNKSRHNWERNR